MTDRTWTGSVNHNARNPNNWDPTGAPQPDDNLTLPGGSTINIRGRVLQGDTLTIPDENAIGIVTTLNVSSNADVSLQAGLHLGGAGTVEINVHGFDSLAATLPASTKLVVNLDDHSVLLGNLNLGWDTSTIVSAGVASAFINHGTETLAGATAKFDADVLGSGTFSVGVGIGPTAGSVEGSSLEFGGFVSHEQTIELTGINLGFLPIDRPSTLTVDHPGAFHGTVSLLNGITLADFADLAQADLWTYKHDMLSIFDGAHHVIDRIHVLSEPTVADSVHGLSISKDAAGDVLVKPGTNFHGSLT